MHGHQSTTNYLTGATADQQHSSGIDLDQSLTTIQFSRRLQKITSSIESFFQSQLDRLENAMASCQNQLDRADEVQRMGADFQRQKQRWETSRESEVARLDRAAAQLTEGWKQLEEARRHWLTERSTQKTLLSGRAGQPTTNASWIESFQPEDQSSQPAMQEMDAEELDSLRQAMQQHRNRQG